MLWTVILGGEPVALVSAEGPEAAVRMAAHLSAMREEPGKGATLAAWSWANLMARPPSAKEAELWRERTSGIAGEVAVAGFILERPDRG
jgi:hypothetical protein